MGTQPELFSSTKLINDAYNLSTNSISTNIVNQLTISGATIIEGDATGVLGIRVYGGPTDPLSDIPVHIDLAHHQIHEGETHQYNYPPTPLGNGSTLNILLKSGNLSPIGNRTANVVFEIDTTVETWLYLYETPTVTANGTQKVLYNRNRNSLNTPNSLVYEAPTVTATGTLLHATINGAGKSGGLSRDSYEWIFKHNTDYLFQIIGKNTGNNISFRVILYEDLGV